MKLNGVKLKDARESRGLTQKEFSTQVGISRYVISRAENEIHIRVKTGRLLCAFLGLDLPGTIVAGSNDKKAVADNNDNDKKDVRKRKKRPAA